VEPGAIPAHPLSTTQASSTAVIVASRERHRSRSPHGIVFLSSLALQEPDQAGRPVPAVKLGVPAAETPPAHERLVLHALQAGFGVRMERAAGHGKGPRPVHATT